MKKRVSARPAVQAKVPPRKKGEDLNPREIKFVEAYMGEAKQNGKVAAGIAGYSGDDATLYVTATRLLRKTKIRKAIQERVETDPLAATRQERLRLLTRIMNGEEKETRKAKDGALIKVPPSIPVRMAALKMLGDMAGDYVQKTELTVVTDNDVRAALERAKQKKEGAA